MHSRTLARSEGKWNASVSEKPPPPRYGSPIGAVEMITSSTYSSPSRLTSSTPSAQNDLPPFPLNENSNVDVWRVGRDVHQLSEHDVVLP